MADQTLIQALNAIFPPEMVGPGKGIGLTLVYRRRQVVSALRTAQSRRDGNTLARNILLRQPGLGDQLWHQREAILALLEEEQR